jgi:hypothetical protein
LPLSDYRETLALATPRGMRPEVAHCHLGLGKLYRGWGDRELAQQHLTTATSMYREMGMTYWLEQAEGLSEIAQAGADVVSRDCEALPAPTS